MQLVRILFSRVPSERDHQLGIKCQTPESVGHVPHQDDNSDYEPPPSTLKKLHLHPKLLGFWPLCGKLGKKQWHMGVGPLGPGEVRLGRVF